VIFKAAAGAAPAGALADLKGTHVDPKTAIEGHLSQLTWLVIGQNQNLFWGHTADRMALVLTQEAPFTVDIVQPKVPLVRNGSMDLKVVATRKPGFDAPINVRMLYNPAGVGSASSVTIPQGQKEITLPLNANGGAPIAKFKIAVIASGPVGNATIQCSSDFAELAVADQFFDFAFQKAAVEQGKESEVLIKLTQKAPFEGSAKVELFGLPNEVTTQPREFPKTATELVFPVKTTKNSPAGNHRSLVCRVVFVQDGEPITHTLGTGELRIDVPIPPKVNTPAPPPMPMPQPMPAQPAKQPERRLTRLEQLRLEREQARKAAEEAEKAKAKEPTPPAKQ
jgi:hypothetical protein